MCKKITPGSKGIPEDERSVDEPVDKYVHNSTTKNPSLAEKTGVESRTVVKIPLAFPRRWMWV
jgi:hypothetical protein